MIVPLESDDGQMIGIAAIMRDAATRFEETRAVRRRIGDAEKAPRHSVFR